MPKHDLSEFDDMVVFANPPGVEPARFSNDSRWPIYLHLKAQNDAMDEADRLDEDPPYNTWTNEELRLELMARKLDTSGKKADMVARLEKWDEDNPEVDDEDEEK